MLLTPIVRCKLYRLVRIGLTLEQKLLKNYIELHRRIFKMAKKMTKKEFDAYLDKTGSYHDADPRHSMNSEKTGPSTLSIIVGIPKEEKKKNKKKGMMGGGYMKKKAE